MVANNMSELNTMLMNHLNMAMTSARGQMLDDMKKETSAFYTMGSPKMYKRTGTLGNTPRVSPLSVGANQVSFDAYLDQSHGYSTGTFSMNEVLTNAEAHTAGILGKPHFWENSEKRMKKTFEKTIKRFFK